MSGAVPDDEGIDDQLEAGLADLYRALGTLYLEPPEAETVTALEQWCELVVDDPDVPGTMTDAADSVLEAASDPDELRPAFTRLFLGISEAQSPPPPYESLYVDGALNGPSSAELEAFYLEAGVELAVEDDLVDHAGYELAFLGELCASGARKRQRVFIERFVGDWLAEFHETARDHDVPPFYRGVFELTEAVLDLHVEALEEDGVSVS